ncbi:MAG: RNA-binding S4 domain-containing protein [Lentimicrobiaceae bacterium]|jgi:ribosome-associated heat shock protein Hsp15|nr:RNA-binding S4 domain-containing protein [Lentimicrobiaceae bacterium]MCP4909484.1 RNA-binding S4 domain-containing protein [Bacteroidota bacterium]MBT3455145.1 RNA-binding S4 domain-containing protein [Lentimicrobiaceae bacterium]MBT3819373.1 RNA-binding S4 domain-containing protein [Lentimicrobiaceae bacterium]MBT4060909.1 RNA-binding S4 domain-containing protein [Lentimicrobiaceae bacterium]
MESIRIDKWLWVIRIFKTRSQASEACNGGKVKIDGHNAKPSREIRVNDIIDIQQSGIRKTVKVLKIHKNRVAAKLVPDIMQDLTPPEEYERLEMIRQLNIEKRERGAGRPTKKDRRNISKLKGFE